MSNFLQILSEYGAGAFILLVIAWLGLLWMKGKVKSAANDVFQSNPTTPPGIRLNNPNDLRYHSFFQNAQYRLVVEIASLDLAPDKPVKQTMFRDLLYWKIKYIHDMCQELAELDMTGWGQDQWANEITKRVGVMLLAYNRKVVESGIPEVALIKFNRWHTTTIEMLYDYITVLGTSSIYSNNIARTNTLFLIMDLLLVTTIGDAERSLRELNGEIGGKEYKGMILEH